MAHIFFPSAGQERRAFRLLQSGQVDFDIYIDPGQVERLTMRIQ